MEEKKIIQLKQGLTTAFINYSHASNLAYKPQFISNNYKEGRKVISSVEDELLNCEEFAISVAFITMGGITPLLQTLRELKYRGVRGKILTTDYLTFSEPEALRKLAQFENLELKMFVTENRKEGFHTKGYIFKKEEIYRIIVGSSNMTSSALTTNREWNTKIVSTEQGEYTHNVVEEFDQLWNSEQVLPFEEFIERYTENKHIVNSKYIRQVILGNCNPRRQVTYEKYLMDLVLEVLIDELGYSASDIAFFSNDEIVIDMEKYKDCINKQKILEMAVNVRFNIPFRIELFYLHKITGTDGYYKEIVRNIIEREYEFKCLNNYTLPFVLRKFNREEITENDKVFYHEGLLSKFMEVPNMEVKLNENKYSV